MSPFMCLLKIVSGMKCLQPWLFPFSVTRNRHLVYIVYSFILGMQIVSTPRYTTKVGGQHVLTLSFTIFRKVGSFTSLQVAICLVIQIDTEVKRTTTSKTLWDPFHFCAFQLQLGREKAEWAMQNRWLLCVVQKKLNHLLPTHSVSGSNATSFIITKLNLGAVYEVRVASEGPLGLRGYCCGSGNTVAMYTSNLRQSTKYD